MGTLTLNFQAYGAQHDFLIAEQHFVAARGGIGSGKSYAGAMRAIMAALGYIGGKQISVPNLGIVTAPTYPMLKDASLRTFRDLAGGLVSSFNKNDMLATLANGSEILFRSADNPDRLRGPTISWWWGDEAAYYTDKVWKVMIGRLREKGKLGYAWLTTTPKGRNWLYKEFVQRRRDQYAMFQMRTVDSPFLDDLLYETWAEAYAGDWAAQELEGEFIAFEGLIYPDFDRGRHVASKRPETFKEVVAGVDWGFANPGVILIAGIDWDGRYWVLHEEYQRKRQIDEWAELAAQLGADYLVHEWYPDPAEPDYIRRFIDKGLPVEKAKNDVTAGIQAVTRRLRGAQPQLVIDPSCANLITEFEQYQWAEGRDGVKDAPKKVNDHAMDALRYMIYSHEQTESGTMTVETGRYA